MEESSYCISDNNIWGFRVVGSQICFLSVSSVSQDEAEGEKFGRFIEKFYLCASYIGRRRGHLIMCRPHG